MKSIIMYDNKFPEIGTRVCIVTDKGDYIGISGTVLTEGKFGYAFVQTSSGKVIPVTNKEITPLPQPKRMFSIKWLASSSLNGLSLIPSTKEYTFHIDDAFEIPKIGDHLLQWPSSSPYGVPQIAKVTRVLPDGTFLGFETKVFNGINTRTQQKLS